MCTRHLWVGFDQLFEHYDDIKESTKETDKQQAREEKMAKMLHFSNSQRTTFLFDDRTMKATGTSSGDEEQEEEEADQESSLTVGVRINNNTNNARTKKKQQQQSQSQSVRVGSGDEWNDSALVNAYNVAINSYRNKKSLTKSVKPEGKKGGGEYLAVPNADESQQEDEEKKLKKEKKKKTKKTKEDEEEVYREQQQHDGRRGYYEQEESENEHHHRANHGEYYYFQQPPRYPHYPPPRSLSDYYAYPCLLYTSPSPRDRTRSRMPSSA